MAKKNFKEVEGIKKLTTRNQVEPEQNLSKRGAKKKVQINSEDLGIQFIRRTFIFERIRLEKVLAIKHWDRIETYTDLFANMMDSYIESYKKRNKIDNIDIPDSVHRMMDSYTDYTLKEKHLASIKFVKDMSKGK